MFVVVVYNIVIELVCLDGYDDNRQEKPAFSFDCTLMGDSDQGICQEAQTAGYSQKFVPERVIRYGISAHLVQHLHALETGDRRKSADAKL